MRGWVVVAGCGAALAAAEGIANACSPPRPGIQGREILPPDGAVDVPVNAEVRIRYAGSVSAPDAQVRVRKPGELAVDAEVESARHAYDTSIVVRPTQPLAPNTTYEILDRLEVPCDGWDDCDAGGFSVFARFETGDGRDDEPPQFAGLETLDSRHDTSDGSCGSYSTVRFTLSYAPASDDGPAEWLRYNLYDGDGRRVAALLPRTRVSGQTLCSGRSDFWPIDATFAGPTGTYMVRAVDLAGNEDGNERRMETIACPGGCALRSPHGSPGAGLLALIAAAILALWRGVAPRRRT